MKNKKKSIYDMYNYSEYNSTDPDNRYNRYEWILNHISDIDSGNITITPKPYNFDTASEDQILYWKYSALIGKTDNLFLSESNNVRDAFRNMLNNELKNIEHDKSRK